MFRNSEAPRPVPSPISAPDKKSAKQKAKKVSAAVESETAGAVPVLATDVNAKIAPPEKVSIAPPDDETQVAAAEATKMKPIKKKKKAAKKAQPKKETKEENVIADEAKERQSAGVASSDGSSAGELVAESGDILGGEQSTLNNVNKGLVGEGDGWQTVGKEIATDNGQGKNVSMVSNVAQNADYDFSKPAKKTTATEPTTVAPKKSKKASWETAAKSAPKSNGASNDITSKKSKPARGMTSAAPVVPEVASMDDDAALAFKLQEEEEKLAKAFSSPENEDSWAEVTPKKGRRRSAEPEAGAAPAATAAW